MSLVLYGMGCGMIKPRQYGDYTLSLSPHGNVLYYNDKTGMYLGGLMCYLLYSDKSFLSEETSDYLNAAI